jgi:hypothetical protein
MSVPRAMRMKASPRSPRGTRPRIIDPFLKPPTSAMLHQFVPQAGRWIMWWARHTHQGALGEEVDIFVQPGAPRMFFVRRSRDSRLVIPTLLVIALPTGRQRVPRWQLVWDVLPDGVTTLSSVDVSCFLRAYEICRRTNPSPIKYRPGASGCARSLAAEWGTAFIITPPTDLI